MVLLVNMLFLLFGLLLFAPLPPIHPLLPRPLQLRKLAVEQHKVVAAVPSQRNLPDASAPAVLATQALDLANLQLNGEARNQLYQRVAARSLGEGSFALAEIACTMKNRLRLSRASLSVVLRAYHAADVSPKPAQIEIVRQVFEGELPCPESWWYALSLQDTHYWRPHQRGPAKTIKQNDRKQVLIFDR